MVVTTTITVTIVHVHAHVMMNDGNNNDNSDYCPCTCTLSMVSLIEKQNVTKTEILKDRYLVALFHVLIVLSIAVADLKAVVSCSD